MPLSAEGKHAEAEAAFAKVAEKGTAGYRDLARLQAAANWRSVIRKPRSKPMTRSQPTRA